MSLYSIINLDKSVKRGNLHLSLDLAITLSWCVYMTYLPSCEAPLAGQSPSPVDLMSFVLHDLMDVLSTTSNAFCEFSFLSHVLPSLLVISCLWHVASYCPYSSLLVISCLWHVASYCPYSSFYERNIFRDTHTHTHTSSSSSSLHLVH